MTAQLVPLKATEYEVDFSYLTLEGGTGHLLQEDGAKLVLGEARTRSPFEQEFNRQETT